MVFTYNIGQSVYLKVDEEQKEGIITAITIRPKNSISYAVSYGGVEIWVYDFELNEEPETDLERRIKKGKF